MNLLFVHHSFPGQLATLLAALAAQGRHQLVFVTQAAQGRVGLPGVTVVPYSFRATSLRTEPNARGLDEAMRRARAVAEVAAGLRAAGFVPDLVIGHEGWGDTLHLCDVWPGVKQIGFREYFYSEDGTDVGCDPEFPVQPWQRAGVRAKNAVPALALLDGHPGVSPTRWQRDQYPAWARPGITVIEDPVDLQAYRPVPGARGRPFALHGIAVAPEERLLTFIARSLEPYRGVHVLLRALPRLLARPELRIVCLGSTAPCYGPPPPRGTWWDHLLAELAAGAGGPVDLSRLHAPGTVSRADCARLLQRSDVHAYLSYPFIASWSLREALACGCAVLAADTAPAREFVTDGATGALIPPLDPAAFAGAALDLLDDAPRRAALGAGARRWAERHLCPESHLRQWGALIQAVSGQDVSL